MKAITKQWVIALTVLLLARSASAQALHGVYRYQAAQLSDARQAARAANATRPLEYKTVRYLEDYRWLADTDSEDAWRAIKYVPLWPDGYLSIGGQLRLRYEWTDPTSLGVPSGAPAESVLLLRNLVHLDAHLLSALRVFAQLGNYYAFGAHPSAPPRADTLDVAQLFVETNAQLGKVQLIARLGRMEMPLGSGRWVGTRDGTNVRQAFDLARLTMVAKRFSVETFWGVLPKLRRGVFDDLPQRDDRFWGAYTTVAVDREQTLGLDAFYLGRDRPGVTYRELSGRELRHTLGLRLFGKTPFGLDWQEHALLQLGTLESEGATADVLAWGLASELSQRLPAPLSALRVGLRNDALSGDARAGDRLLSTFSPLIPNQPFYSAFPAIFPTNLYTVYPLLRFEQSSLAVQTGCVLYWRKETHDAIYAPPGRVVVSSTSSPKPSRTEFTGALLSLSAELRLGAHFSLRAEYARLFAGSAIREAGGEAVHFAGSWATFTY